jgi:ornithine cyclodeaminase
MKTLKLDQIKAILPTLDLLPAIETGFAAYSTGQAVVPPVGELLLDEGEVHIKYGFIHEQPYYVIKIASGFYNNPSLGLPSSDGLMLVFDQKTGQLSGILLDEGYLTNVRTAVAGAIAAKYLAPESIQRIGIVGSGTQARMQLTHLKQITACRDILVWGLVPDELPVYQDEMTGQGFRVETTFKAGDILRSCNLIVTATPATAPILQAADLQAGTHITAVGSDTPEKQELEATILERADLVVADSISQCLLRGEIHQAIKTGQLRQDRVVELGDIIAGKVLGRTNESQITVADLTGVAVQDIQIASMVYEAGV